MRAALERHLPLLGICRGMQVINVALRRHAGAAPARADDAPAHARDLRDHEVELEPGSLAARAAGGGADRRPLPPPPGGRRLGEGLRVTGQSVGDGVVEAVEARPARFALGVLWHPEEERRAR